MSEQVGEGLVPELRFPEFFGLAGWEYKKLNSYLEAHSEKVSASDTTLPIYSSTREGLKLQKDYYNGRELVNDGDYGVVPEGFFVYRHMSDDTIFRFNINNTKEKIAVSKEYPVFKVRNLNSYFLLQKLNYGADFQRFAILQKKGGTRTRLYFKTLCSWMTLLPSLSEQEKIADCFYSIDDLIAESIKKHESLKLHKKGLVQKLFPPVGESAPKLRFPEFRCEKEWVGILLKKVFSIIQGFAFSSSDNEKNGVRWLKIADVSIQKMNHSTPSYLPSEYKDKHKKYLVEHGDYVIALTRPILKKQLKIACVDEVFHGALLNQRVGKLKTNQNIAFVYFLLQTSKVIDDIEMGISGSEPPNLSVRQIEDIGTHIPSEEEQQKIADCLSSIDGLITAQAQKIEALKAHKKGLMQQLFPAIDEVNA